MKKIFLLFILLCNQVYSQEVIVLGCEGEIKNEVTIFDDSKPEEKNQTINKVFTEVIIDKKKKILKFQEKQLDQCSFGKCECDFNQNWYECKGGFKTENTTEKFYITIGRKTGIVEYSYFYEFLSVSNNHISTMISSRTNSRLICDAKQKNKF